MARTHFQTGMLYIAGKRTPRWYGRYREYILSDGRMRPIYRNAPLGPVKDFTKPQAKRLLADKLGSINSWNCKPRQLITFREFADTWLKVAERDYRPSNWGTIKGHVANHLNPFFGEMQMGRIDQFAVKRFMASVCRKNHRPAAATTRRHIFTTLSTIWRAASDWDIVDTDKPVRIKMPRPHWEPRRILSTAEVKRILGSASEPYRSAYQLMSERGALAISEACGLNVGDIDKSRPVVHVRRSFTHGRLGAPKARARERSVTISIELHERLLAIAGSRKDTDPLFINGAGRRWDQLNVLRRHLYPLCDAIEIPRTGFHAFRHFAITSMGECGVPLKTAAAWAGHSDPALTARVYMHARLDDDHGYGEKLAKLLADSEPSIEPKSPVASIVKVGTA